jgi:DNA-binding transcriptional regulator YhcF (GntR family)
MSGWIKLNREINNHWVFQNSDYFKWWIDILLEVNYTPAKVVIKGKVYECGRGEKLYSLDTWAMRWKTNKSKVRRYFDLLQKENMIELKNETQTTRLKVCKYEDYQETENESETQTKRKRNANETQMTPIKESNNNNKDNKDSLETRSLAFKETLRPFINKFGVDMVKNFYGYWSEPNQSKTKMLFEMQKTWDTSRRLETWSKRESSFTKKEDKPKNLGI